MTALLPYPGCLALEHQVTLEKHLTLTLILALTPTLTLTQVALKQHLRGEAIPCTQGDDSHPMHARGEFAGLHRLLSPRQAREMSEPVRVS